MVNAVGKRCDHIGCMVRPAGRQSSVPSTRRVGWWMPPQQKVRPTVVAFRRRCTSTPVVNGCGTADSMQCLGTAWFSGKAQEDSAVPTHEAKKRRPREKLSVAVKKEVVNGLRGAVMAMKGQLFELLKAQGCGVETCAPAIMERVS